MFSPSYGPHNEGCNAFRLCLNAQAKALSAYRYSLHETGIASKLQQFAKFALTLGLAQRLHNHLL